MTIACCCNPPPGSFWTTRTVRWRSNWNSAASSSRLVPALTPTRPAIGRFARRRLPQRELIFQNGLGGFTRDGHEYVITLQPGQMTPAPWVNVLANPSFGTVISESGSAYTWVENAHEFRLTPWHNDPVQDTSGEAFYIRDEETGQVLVADAVARARRDALCHSPRFWLHRLRAHRERHRLRVVGLCGDGRAGQVDQFEIAQRLGRPAPLVRHRLLGMGPGRSAAQDVCCNVQTEVDLKTGALLARNFYNTEFPDRIVFLDVNDPTSHAHRRSEGIPRTERKPGATSGTEARAPFRQSRCGPGSLRRGAGRLRFGAMGRNARRVFASESAATRRSAESDPAFSPRGRERASRSMVFTNFGIAPSARSTSIRPIPR